MARQHIYTVYSKAPGQYRVEKMERDFEPVGYYEVSRGGAFLHCTCYASNKITCRHRQIVELFEDQKKVNSRIAYDFDKKQWIPQPKLEA